MALSEAEFEAVQLLGLISEPEFAKLKHFMKVEFKTSFTVNFLLANLEMCLISTF